MFARILLCSILFGGIVAAQDIEVKNAYVFATPPNANNAAIYMTIHNKTNNDIVLDSVTSKVSKIAEIHTHIHNGEMIEMKKLSNLTISASDSVIFEPGGKHIMLIDIFQPLKEGQNVDIEMHFTNGATLYINDIPVVKKIPSIDEK